MIYKCFHNPANSVCWVTWHVNLQGNANMVTGAEDAFFLEKQSCFGVLSSKGTKTNKNSPSRRSVQVKKAWKITWQVIQKSVEPPDQGSFLHSQIRYPKPDIRQSWMGNQKSRGKNKANTQWKQHPSSRPQWKSRRRNGSRRRLCLTWSQHFELLK